MGKDIKKSSKPTKWVALATYAIALLCLLAGLLVPLAPVPLKEAFKLDNMLVMQAFAALGAFGLKIPFAPDTFVYSYANDVKIFGVIPAFDLGAVLVLLYVLVCVIALIGLIPVIASNRYKRTALRTASFIEVLGAIVAGLFVLVQLGQFAVSASYWNNWTFAPVIALGGCVLMLLIQSIAYRKGSGVIKFVLLLLSVVAVFCALFAGVASSKLSGIVGKLPAVIGDYSLYNNGDAVFGALILSPFFAGEFGLIFTGAILEKVLAGVVLALSLLVVINAILDLMGLGKTTKFYMLVANIVRYVLELIAIILFVVFTFVVKVQLGFFGYVLAVVALLQFIINLIRLLVFISKKKKGGKNKSKKTVATVNETNGENAENAEEATEEKVDKKAAKRAAKEAKKAEKEAKKNAVATEETEETAAAEATPVAQRNADPSVYVVEPTYDGPVDDFIKTLTNAERIEFARCFIEKKLILPNVPDYVVGGNNKKFFEMVFIYWRRLTVSDGLMNKLYEQGNIM